MATMPLVGVRVPDGPDRPADVVWIDLQSGDEAVRVSTEGVDCCWVAETRKSDGNPVSVHSRQRDCHRVLFGF